MHTVPPFRADHVGSLLRSAPLKEARAKRENGEITPEQLKAVEKGRSSAMDGVPTGLPALAYASKLVGRARRHGVTSALPAPAAVSGDVDPHAVGELLLAVVALADAHGIDPEQALRDSVRRLRDTVVRQEDAVARPDR